MAVNRRTRNYLSLSLSLLVSLISPAALAQPVDPFFTRRIPHTEQLAQDSWYGRISQGKNLPELDGPFFVLSTSSSVTLSGGNASGTNGYRQVFRFSRDAGGEMATAHISRQPGQTGQLASANSDSPSISEDGKVVVFSTSAPLISVDTNAKLDVYTRILTSDLGAGQTVLLSARRDGLGNIVAIGNDHSNLACVSGNGRFVAFSSSASNLLSTDFNGTYSDVFVVELVFDGAGVFQRAVTPEIVSINNSGSQSQSSSFTGFFTVGRNLAVPRSISHDGCRVAFYGRPCDWLGDLCPARDDSVYGDECSGMCTSTIPEQVYVRDRGTCGGPPKTFLVSRASRLSGGGIFSLAAAKGGQSLGGSISADGSTIAFSSFGTNFRATGTDSDSFEDVFPIAFADLGAVPINPQRVSIPHTNNLADIDGSSFNPMLSKDGLRVAFASHATKVVPFRHQREEGRICPGPHRHAGHCPFQRGQEPNRGHQRGLGQPRLDGRWTGARLRVQCHEPHHRGYQR